MTMYQTRTAHCGSEMPGIAWTGILEVGVALEQELLLTDKEELVRWVRSRMM